MPQQQSFIVPLALMLVVWYFLLIRPQRKKDKEHKDMISSLKKNDEVVTIGGIHGVVVLVKEKTLTVRVADTTYTKIEIDKNSVGYLKKSSRQQAVKSG